MREELEQLATSFLEAFNANDVDSLTRLIGSDAVYRGPVTAPDGTQISSLLAAVERTKEAGPQIAGTVPQWIVDVDLNTMVGEVVWENPALDDAPRLVGSLVLVVEAARIVEMRENHGILPPSGRLKDCPLWHPVDPQPTAP